MLENIATERGARTIAVDEKTHKVYLPTAMAAPSTGRRPRDVFAGHVQGADGRQMSEDVCQCAAPVCLGVSLCASWAGRPRGPGRPAAPAGPPRSDRPAPPVSSRWQDALATGEAERRTVSGERRRRGDRARGSRAGEGGHCCRRFSATTQYLGNQPNGVNPNGRFVSLDGVNMYRAWGVVRTRSSPPTRSCAAPVHRGAGRRGGGGGETRGRAARSRGHRDANLLRARRCRAPVRDRAAGRAAGGALPRDHAAAGARSARWRAATS